MDFKENPVKAGWISKIHAVKGGMNVHLLQDWSEPAVWPAWVFIRFDGELVPCRLNSENCFLKDSRNMVIFIDEVTSPEMCDEFMGKEFWMPKESFADLLPEGFNPKVLIGYKVKIAGEDEEIVGVVVDYLPIPGNELFSITWADKNILVSASEEFILEVDTDRQILTFSLPEGLLDLN